MTDADRIRRLLAEYCQLLDGRRYVEFGQLFAPAGVWLLGGRENRGPAEVTAYMDQLLIDHPNRRSTHLNTNLDIQVDGETATAASDYVMLTRTEGGPWGVLATGRYHDRLARQADGTWRFAERRLVS